MVDDKARAPAEEKEVLVVPAQTAELPRVNQFLHAGLDRHLCPAHARGQLDIAVEELFVNVCRYAYEGAGADVARTVCVTQAFGADPPSITVEIVDSGAPFDPLAKPDAAPADSFESVADVPIGGLGILMAKQSVDEMRYERVDGRNVVTLFKLLD